MARVALPVPVDELFEYTIPAARAAAIRPGCRVRVRFGGRTLVGVVVERADRAGYPGRLRAIEAVIDEAPVLSRELLDVLREAARDVLCPVGLALAAALPSGSAPFFARGFALTPRGRAAAQSGAVRGAAARALAALATGPVARAALARQLGARRPAALAALERDGLIAPCEVEQGPRARAATERVASLAPGVDLAAARAALARAPRQLDLLEQLAAGDRLAAALPARRAARARRARLRARAPARSAARRARRAARGRAPRRAHGRPGARARADHVCDPAARAEHVPAARRHGQRKDRDVPARGGGRARRGPARARARARDHAHPSDPGPAARPLRRCARRAPQRAAPGRAARAVAAPAQRRGADRGRRALRAVRADREPRPRRDRRGARRRVQERGGLPLPRARSRAPARARGGLPGGARIRDAFARGASRGRSRRAHAARARAPDRRPAAARGGDRRPRARARVGAARAQARALARAARGAVRDPAHGRRRRSCS